MSVLAFICSDYSSELTTVHTALRPPLRPSRRYVRVSPVFLNRPVEFLLLQSPRQGPHLSLWPHTLSGVLLDSATFPGACLTPAWGPLTEELCEDL